ncbi:hypothetical protein L1049_000320 [Liquidambar formosana]|uniref:Uncharacterized protein n=1 Tax=Liquidambar formosana TaxID=63359 RepID=A0AAP0NAT7_LIQFO
MLVLVNWWFVMFVKCVYNYWEFQGLCLIAKGFIGGMWVNYLYNCFSLQSASKEANANVHVEDFDKGVSALEANIEGSVNCLEHGVGSVGNGIKNIQEQIVVLDGLREDGANQNKESLEKEVSKELQVNIEKTKH